MAFNIITFDLYHEPFTTPIFCDYLSHFCRAENLILVIRGYGGCQRGINGQDNYVVYLGDGNPISLVTICDILSGHRTRLGIIWDVSRVYLEEIYVGEVRLPFRLEFGCQIGKPLPFVLPGESLFEIAIGVFNMDCNWSFDEFMDKIMSMYFSMTTYIPL
jgi:hypothetical protein